VLHPIWPLGLKWRMRDERPAVSPCRTQGQSLAGSTAPSCRSEKPREWTSCSLVGRAGEHLPSGCATHRGHATGGEFLDLINGRDASPPIAGRTHLRAHYLLGRGPDEVDVVSLI
jgi:hypothetical protein